MFRRFAATLVAVLVLAVVSAMPALAKPHPAQGSGTASAPGASGSAPGHGKTTGGSDGTSSGAGGAGTTGGPADSSKNSGATESKTTTKDDKKSDGKAKPAVSATPSRTPVSTGAPTQAVSSATSSPATEVPLVRAQAAAPSVSEPDTTALPAPNPMLLPDGSTNAAGATPVDVERSSSLPQALPPLLIGAGLLSVAGFGALLARRHFARPNA